MGKKDTKNGAEVCGECGKAVAVPEEDCDVDRREIIEQRQSEIQIQGVCTFEQDTELTWKNVPFIVSF